MQDGFHTFIGLNHDGSHT